MAATSPSCEPSNAGAVVILGSATPSLETRYNASTGKYVRLALPERIEKRPMPKVTLVDMRQEFLETRKQATFSRALIEAVDERLKNGEQTMLLLNRRGFSSFVACRACGERVQCANCSVTLTFHRRDRRMLCHYCNYSERVPERCPKCDSDYIQFLGLGSERLEEELHGAFPKARIARLDRDSVRGKNDYETVLSAFRAGEYDVLVGTQMIAKGHDIPNVTLVGIINADIGLGLPDFRAARTHFPASDASGRTCGTRRDSRHRADPDDQSGSLRRSLRGCPGLRSVLPKGNRIPAFHVVSAVFFTRERDRARDEGRGSTVAQRGTGPPFATGSGRRPRSRPGRRGHGEAEERVSLSDAGQSVVAKTSRRRARRFTQLRASREMERGLGCDRRRSDLPDVKKLM